MSDVKSVSKINDMFKKIIVEETEKTTTLKIEYQKKGHDGKSYGIFRERGFYIIKEANKNGNLLSEDFKYMNNQPNDTRYRKETLQESIKYLNAFINEKKYVLNTPQPVQMVQPVQPVQQTTEPTVEPANDSSNQDMSDDMGDEPVEDDGFGEDTNDNNTNDGSNNGSDDEDTSKQIQKLTGKLGQLYNANKDDESTTMTVGSLKSLLAQGANKLSDNEKQAILSKAKEEMDVDDNDDDGDDDDFEMNESIIKEDKGDDYQTKFNRVKAELDKKYPKKETGVVKVDSDFDDEDEDVAKSEKKRLERLENKKKLIFRRLGDAEKFAEKTVEFLRKIRNDGKVNFNFGWLVEPNKGFYGKPYKSFKGQVDFKNAPKIGVWTLRVDFLTKDDYPTENITAIIHYDNLISGEMQRPSLDKDLEGIAQPSFEIDLHINNKLLNATTGKLFNKGKLEPLRPESKESEKIDDKNDLKKSVEGCRKTIYELESVEDYNEINKIILSNLNQSPDMLADRAYKVKIQTYTRLDIKKKLDEIITNLTKFKGVQSNTIVSPDVVNKEIVNRTKHLWDVYYDKKKYLEKQLGRELNRDENEKILPSRKGGEAEIIATQTNKEYKNKTKKDLGVLSDSQVMSFIKSQTSGIPNEYLIGRGSDLNGKRSTILDNIFFDTDHIEMLRLKEKTNNRSSSYTPKPLKELALDFFKSFAQYDYEKLMNIRKALEIDLNTQRLYSVKQMYHVDEQEMASSRVPRDLEIYTTMLGFDEENGNKHKGNLTWDGEKTQFRKVFLDICDNIFKAEVKIKKLEGKKK